MLRSAVSPARPRAVAAALPFAQAAPPLDIGKHRRGDGVAKACGECFRIPQPEGRRDARKGCYKVGGVDVVKFGLALDPDHPLRCELIITADLATTPQAAAVVASIVEEGRRHAGEPDFAGVDAVPARPNVAAEIAAGPGDRRAIERRRFG